MPDNPKKKFYLTTPIYYVNARPHIGHAYSTIAADVIARRHRLLGDDTFFLTGTDEHGQKVQRSAAAAGIPPQQFTDEVSATFQNLWKRMGITNDDYIRTTDERHKRGVQKLWRVLEERGAIYLDSYTGAYCVSDETFVDLPAGTPCPDCGRPLEIVTEENYFFKLKKYQKDLIDLIESDDPNAPLRIQPEAVRKEVLSFLRGNVASVMPENAEPFGPSYIPTVAQQKLIDEERLGISIRGNFFVPGALKDLSISRTTFDWGIPVPGNDKHVVYVWLDALANYITAIGYGGDDPADKAKFEKYWPADLHLVGKEITRFHCVYWPAFLMAAGLPLPKSVVANGWLLFEESKMSKSRGNVVRTETILDAFGDEVYGKQFPASTKAERDLFAADVLRYFLLREIPFGQDGSFSFDALAQRYNSDLVNGYGNLVSRALSMIAKNFEGIVAPATGSIEELHIPLGSGDGPLRRFVWGTETVRQFLTLTTYVFDEKFSSFQFSAGRGRNLADETESIPDIGPLSPKVEYGVLDSIWSAIEIVNGFFSGHEPWKLVGEDREKLATILYTAAESIRIITALLYPFMPYSAASVWRQLGLGSIEEAARNGELKDLQWGCLKPGTKLGALAPIFPRADKGLAQTMTDMENPATPPATEPTPEAAASEPTAEALNAVNPATAPATENGQRTTDNAPPATPRTANLEPRTSTITIDDFAKIDLRVAQIVVAERIPKADKLLRLEVDLGFERRQILSGIAEFYTPEELLGKRIAIIANLAPRKMRGLESHGMLLAASGEDHSSKPILATFSDDIALGSKIR